SLYMFPCQWNYRPDHCIYGTNCQQAEEEGVFILHGNRGVYHNDKQPAFRAVYEAVKQVERRHYSNISLPAPKIFSCFNSSPINPDEAKI
ncbi:Glucoside xylosyltransferase 1, partial [Xenoophorus captivus]